MGGLQGGTESDPWRPPSDVGQAAAPGGLRRPKHPLGSKKKQGLSQQSTGGRGRVGAAGGRTGMSKYNKVIK